MHRFEKGKNGGSHSNGKHGGDGARGSKIAGFEKGKKSGDGVRGGKTGGVEKGKRTGEYLAFKSGGFERG